MSESTTVRYRPGRDPKPADRTDWDRLRAMPDDQVESAARSDPDNPPATDEELERAAFGRRVRAIRERLGLSQGRFAERFRVPPASLRDWEQGRRVPDAATQAYMTVIEREPDAVMRALGTDRAA